jgi:hypothetical protein
MAQSCPVGITHDVGSPPLLESAVPAKNIWLRNAKYVVAWFRTDVCAFTLS